MNDKWGRRIFLAGAVWLLLLGCVHSLSLLVQQVPANDTEKQLLDLMTSYKLNLMGTLRSMDELFRGFSIAFMLAAFGFGGLDLAMAGERSALLKRVALVNVLWLATMTAVSLRYFFALPTSFLAVALVIFVAAWWKLPGQEPS